MSNDEMQARFEATHGGMQSQITGWQACRFAEEEVKLALVPSEASPELVESEKSLRLCVDTLERGGPEVYLHRKRCKPIAAELTRLRAELATAQRAGDVLRRLEALAWFEVSDYTRDDGDWTVDTSAGTVGHGPTLLDALTAALDALEKGTR